MVCLYCGSKTSVINNRRQKRNNQAWRRRQCKACGQLFTSHEAIDLSSALIVQSNGSTKPFLTDMLFTDVLLALQDRKDCYLAAREITSTTIRGLLKLGTAELSAQQISEVTAKVLKRFSRRAWLRYAAEHPSLQVKKV